MSSTRADDPRPLTYGSYLRVPELLSLQTPLSRPEAPGEMLFIILQQAQELWFKQVLHELLIAISSLVSGNVPAAIRHLDRINAILHVLGDEVAVMETMAPRELHEFRDVLGTASGFESAQFRELELVSGLEEPAFLRLAARIVDVDEVAGRWPTTLRAAFHGALQSAGPDPLTALVAVYADPDWRPQLFALAEALSDYEILIETWRFRHLKLVERVIGDRSAGSGGSAGSAYLAKTLEHRFFPELWEARNILSTRGVERY